MKSYSFTITKVCTFNFGHYFCYRKKKQMHYEWNNMLVLNGNIVTDVFFLLSSTLLAYTELLKKELNPEWRFNLIGLYSHRYIRYVCYLYRRSELTFSSAI